MNPQGSGILSLSLNYGFCVGPWCSADWVSSVFGLRFLPHRIDRGECARLKRQNKQTKLHKRCWN